MQFSTLLAPFALMAMVGVSVAEDGKAGLKYCDDSLISRGNYEKTIQNALHASGLPQEQRSKVLFGCLEHGAIEVYTVCSDTCRQYHKDWKNYPHADDFC